MARRYALVLTLAFAGGCSLDKRGTGTSDQLQSDAATDSTASDDTAADETLVILDSADDTALDATMPDTTAIDTAAPDTPPPPPFCDPTDLTLLACYRFEGDGKDGSSYKNNLTVTGGTYVPGVAGQAIDIDKSTALIVGENTSFNVTTQLTIELWLNARTLPTTGRMGLVDDDGRFGLFIYPPGKARGMAPSPLDTVLPLPTGVWTHVAFTFDGETETMFVNGKVSSVAGVSSMFGVPTGAGLAVGGNSPSGDPFDGIIDSVRVFRIARTPAQICAAAGGC